MSIALASLSVADALLLVSRALDEGGKAGLRLAVVVTDRAGQVLASARMDGANALLLGVAQGKALGSVALGAPTQAIAAMMSEDQVLANGILAGGWVVPLAGGLPISEDGQVIGAIGVAGGHYSQDQQVVEAVLAGWQ